MSHHRDGSSIQNHSAGAHYPYVVVVQNDNCYVLHPNGRSELVSTFTFNDRADRVACIGFAIGRAERLAQLRSK